MNWMLMSMSKVFSQQDYAVAMDVLERFMAHDADSSRSRCVQTLIPFFGYKSAKAIVDALLRLGALKQAPGASRAFRTVLRKGDGWHEQYVKSHRVE